MQHKPGIRKTPIADLLPHPSNPRQGDVDAIVQSIRSNGWFGTLVAQTSTGYVLAGNHRLEAAIQCEVDRVPVHWVDVDDDTATRILLADNRTSDLATYDDDFLAELLNSVATSDDGLPGTGYDADDLDLILASNALSLDELASTYPSTPDDLFVPFTIRLPVELRNALAAWWDKQDGETDVDKASGLLDN